MHSRLFVIELAGECFHAKNTWPLLEGSAFSNRAIEKRRLVMVLNINQTNEGTKNANVIAILRYIRAVSLLVAEKVDKNQCNERLGK